MTAILVRTIIIYLILNIMLKLMGKRQIGELEVNELVSTLLISEIASIPISEPGVPLLSSIIPILFICALEVAISAIKTRCAGVKKLVEGTPVYIIYKGKLRQNILADNRISINEIMTEMRTQGIGDISEIEYGILEQNGKLSLFKKDDKIAHPLIIDGRIYSENLKRLGYDEKWLLTKLRDEKLNFNDVFLLTVDDEKNIYTIKKDNEK